MVEKYYYYLTHIVWCPICGENYEASVKKIVTENPKEVRDRDFVEKKICRSCDRDFRGH